MLAKQSNIVVHSLCHHYVMHATKPRPDLLLAHLQKHRHCEFLEIKNVSVNSEV
jgi:hypothetical protein